MRNLIFLIIFGSFLIMSGCSPKGVSNADIPGSENLVINGSEGEEYELTIIDPGFQTWFASYARPINYHSKSYYESQNRRYVSAWNELYQRTGGAGPFGNYVNYDYAEDYGLELNYELFWYFKYVESQYGNRYNFPI